MPEDIRISTRASLAQRNAWRAAARAMNMTPSQYVRRSIEAQMRADRDEAAELVECARLMLSDAHDSGRDTKQEQLRHAAANLRWATLVSALEDFSHA